MTELASNDETRYPLLRALEQDPAVSQRALARALGISLGKVNYCLRALIARGWVKAGNFARSERKSAYAYLLTPAGLAAKARITRRFLHQRLAEYKALQDEIETLRRDLAARPRTPAASPAPDPVYTP